MRQFRVTIIETVRKTYIIEGHSGDDAVTQYEDYLPEDTSIIGKELAEVKEIKVCPDL